MDEALEPSSSLVHPTAATKGSASAAAGSIPAARAAADDDPHERQHASWEAVGQVEPAQVAEQQRLNGEEAGLGPAPSLEGPGDVHVATGQRLQ